MGLLTAIQGRKLYLDANVFIYALEGFPSFQAELKTLFAGIERAELRTVTSQLTLAELLVKPFREGNRSAEANCRRAVRERQGLSVSPVSLEVLVEAARLRAASNLRLPDAIHLATARITDCKVFLTNDKRLSSLRHLDVLYLSDFAKP